MVPFWKSAWALDHHGDNIRENGTFQKSTPLRMLPQSGSIPGREGAGAAISLWGYCRKSETTFVRNNYKLVRQCGFRFSGRASERAKCFAQIREIEVLAHSFEKSKFLFGVFRCAPTKSEITFVYQISMQFQNCGLRYAVRSAEDRPKFPPRNLA